MKANNAWFKEVPLFLLALAFLFCFPSKGAGQSKFTWIKSAIVIDFVDKTKRFDGVKVADLIREEMRVQAPFKVLSKQETLAKFKRLKISRKKMALASYRKATAKYLKVDGIILGVITKEQNRYVLTLKMEKIKPYKVIDKKSFTFRKDIGPNASKFATAKFLGLPYKPAAEPEAFRAEPRVPVAAPTDITEAVTQQEVPMQQALTAEAEGAPAPTLGEEKPAKEAVEGTAGSDKTKRDWLTLKLSPAFYKNTYSVTNPAGSTVAKPIGVSTSLYPNIMFSGELWFIRYLGIDFLYNMGWLKLTVTPPGGTAFDVDTTTMQLSGGIKYRLFFSSIAKSPYAFARVGYNLQTFSPGTQVTNVLSKNTYNDLALGIGMKFPMWFIESTDLGLTFGFDYFLWSDLKEEIINNGTTNSCSGMQIAVGPYWKFYKAMFASFDFVYNKHNASFGDPGTGTRADSVDGAKSSDEYMGLLFFVGVNL